MWLRRTLGFPGPVIARKNKNKKYHVAVKDMLITHTHKNHTSQGNDFSAFFFFSMNGKVHESRFSEMFP